MATDHTQPIVAVTNLYPLPWEPTRAAFNRQQFEALGQFRRVKVAVLVPWRVWIKNRDSASNTNNIHYVPFLNLPSVGRYFTPFFQRLALGRIKQWLLADNPAVFYACWLYPDAVGVARLAEKWRIPCIVKAHGTDVNFHTQDKRKLTQMQRMLTSVKHAFCPSHALRQVLIDRGVNADKISVNYNGVDKQIFYPSDVRSEIAVSEDTPTKLLFVGSLIKAKGIFELIEAFSQLAAPCHLSIVGAGDDEHALRKCIEQTGVSSKVTLLGSQPLVEVARLMRESDVLVLPSYREGLPNVVLEALASGTPVVATRVGGIPEVINERCGVLVEPESAQSLADGLAHAIAQRWDRAYIITHATQFDWYRNAQTVMKCIESVEGHCEN
ncbi:glycosyltransferase [Alteromonas oceanisediminis]|uniref:glycosyltransferase n=1 Tax=Alteromonas oceanisediminis TaxID=2836180 RepID=UPI001BDB0187|nr:glycosyltransferase [Alteromonas oceanisediminis]MBT0585662.1 glycosyltransferase [Alteromonas oceanisediminis]